MVVTLHHVPIHNHNANPLSKHGAVTVSGNGDVLVIAPKIRSSAVAERPRDGLYCSKCCEVTQDHSKLN